MNIWLKEISIQDGEEFFYLLNELSSYKDVYAKPIPEPINYNEYKSFLSARIKLSQDFISLNVIPTNTYWVMNDNEPIGYATLKHKANFDIVGGHLGLCLKKEYQNKGIGKIVSEKLSKIAYEELGIEKLIYTSKIDNKQSQSALRKIGVNYICIKDGYYFYEDDLTKKYGEKRR